MTDKTMLAARRRNERGKGVARKLRASGRIPAVVYGKDQEPISLSVDAHETMHLFQQISVENTIINVEIDGEEEEFETLVREVQTHPFRSDILHVDFYTIQHGVKIELEIPVQFEGTPTGVREGGGILEATLHELRVLCIPSKIPEEIVIDIRGLELGDSLHVSDIDPPEDVEFVTDGGRTICSVALPRVEVEPEEEEEEEEAIEGEAPADAASEAATEEAGGDEAETE